MADDDLIADYLAQLEHSLRWRRDVDAVIVEVDDHLRCASEALIATGYDLTSAQQIVVARFGDPLLVSRSFALTSNGGLAMPTRFTRTAGAVAWIGALAWVAGAAFALLRSEELGVDWQAAYLGTTILVTAAAACTTVTLAGVLRRTGSGGTMVGLAMALSVLATALLAVAVWAWIIGVTLLAGASLIAVLRLHAQRIGPVASPWLLVLSWPLAIALALLLDALQIGPVDSYGDYFLSQLVGFALGCALTAVALVTIGRWLRSEEAAGLPESLATA